MHPTVQAIIETLGQIAPDDLAEGWDNVGLLVGSPSQPVHAILLALDPSLDLIDQAVSQGADLIITHHPVIFHPLRSLQTDQPQGQLLQRALKHGISLIGCHTNLDSTEQGVNDTLARCLGLGDTRPLVPGRGEATTGLGLGRIGHLATPLTAEALLDRINEAVAPPWLLEAGPRPGLVHTVAVCGGSGSDLAETARSMGAEVLLTSELKHATARWAEDAGMWLLDGGHFATENLAMPVLRDLLRQRLDQASITLPLNLASQGPPLRLVQGRQP
jgi:dinuclear metal center YbgI/SA1388 family protein